MADITMKDPNTTEDSNTTEDPNTTEEDLDTIEAFNIPCPKRVSLLEKLQELIGNVPPHFWAACQICDLDALERLAHFEVPFSQAITLEAREMVRHWGSFPGYQSQPPSPKTPTSQTMTTSSPGPSSSPLSHQLKREKDLASPKSLPRDLKFRGQAEERDSFRCVLTGVGLIDVAHIYPRHSMKNKEENKGGLRHRFWNHLEVFWPKEKITAWKGKLFPQGIEEKGYEQVHNLISLSPNAHRIWGQGLFALKPISEPNDKKTLTVQFFWQRKQNDSPLPIPLTTKPYSTEHLDYAKGARGVEVWLNNKDMKRIKSGDCFELQTDDPVQKPLPSFELLEMQWFLHRIQGMAGAVDSDLEDGYWYLDSDSDNADDIPALASDDDVEELSLLVSTPPSFPLNHDSNLSLYPKHQKAGGVGAGIEAGIEA